MSTTQPGLVSQLLEDVSAGDPAAADQLLPLVYDELRRLAHARMRNEPSQTLQPTALVHEAYLRLLGDADSAWQGRGHFFAAAAEAMRRILIERARRVHSAKHGGHLQRVTLGTSPDLDVGDAVDVLALDTALTRLEQKDSRMGAVVKLRFFAGLTLEETGNVLEVDARTVSRDWLAAKAWLYRELEV